jgi:hypothetical protein
MGNILLEAWTKWGEERKNKRKGKKTSDLGDSAHLDHGC